jgi:hypothetical protein
VPIEFQYHSSLTTVIKGRREKKRSPIKSHFMFPLDSELLVAEILDMRK